MTETKHTSGPWSVGVLDAGTAERTVDGPHHQICTCHHHCVGVVEKEMEANAWLIAAAPDMLEALRGLVAENLPEAKAHYEYLLTEGNRAQIDQAESDLQKWENARAAIAKATGGAS